MFLNRLIFGFWGILILFYLACNSDPATTSIEKKINQIQVLGSHNSYKLAMDEALMAHIKLQDSVRANSLDYQHPSLAEQLDLGLRKLELDVFYDPDGGKYKSPKGIQELQEAGVEVEALDSFRMSQPGFKVLHVQDIDFRSSCLTLTQCLEEIFAWSKENPKHVPIVISFNAKEQAITSRPDFTVPLTFTPEAFDELDQEISATIPPSRVITPDEVRGAFNTLEEGVLNHNWPNLELSRGKFLFVLDAGEQQRIAYLKGHPSLKDRLMFVSAPPGKPEAGFVFKNNPIGNIEEIQRLVKLGYLVRTRADAGTKEARIGAYSRFEAALASGAHFISTDYEIPDPRFGTGYHVQLPGKQTVLCNPVVGGNCDEITLE